MIRHSNYASILVAVLALLILVRCGKDSPTKPQSLSPVPSRITITPDAPTLTETGQSTRLNATVVDQNDVIITGLNVIWSSSNSEVARVNTEGVVTAQNSGHARITATSGSVVASVNISVVPTTARIVVTPSMVSLANLGQTQQLSAGFRDGNNDIVSGGSVNWSSSDPKLATISPSGVVTALGRGTVQITATSGNLSTRIGVSIMTSDSDKAILIALYNETNGPNWTNNENWLSEAPLDEWHGVRTDDEGRVVELRLTHNNLLGSIPAELGQLERLQTLTFWSNRLNGPIPPELGQLINLDTLWLASNNLSGTIPPELGQLINLWQFSLAGNQLTGTIPLEFSQLTNLSVLFLGDNDGLCIPENPDIQSWLDGISDKDEVPSCSELEIELLTTFFNATGGPDWTNNENWLSDEPIFDWFGVTTDTVGQVAVINLVNNNLQGTLPFEISDLANLKTLNLSLNTGLIGPLPSKLTAIELESLVLNDTFLCAPQDTRFQDWLNSIPNRSVTTCVDQDTDALIALVGLYNSTNGSEWNTKTHWLTQAPLTAWHGVTADADGRITGLDLSNNNLSGSVPSSLSKLKDLTTLDLSDNGGLSGPLPLSLASISLESLSLEGTQLCAPTDDSFKTWLQGVSDTSGLTDCTSVNPDREALVTLYNVTNGPNWNNNSNWLSAKPMGEWYGVTTDHSGLVTKLRLVGNNLLGTIPPELGQMNMLQILQLGFNELSGPIPPKLGDLQNLRELGIQFCWLSGTIPPQLGRLTNLETLHLWGNGVTLTGALPPELGQLSSLRQLWLSGNAFTGPIPIELGQLISLEEFDLRWNSITGQIPKEIGQLSQLRKLLLIRNKLSGTLPLELGRLQNLLEINLSSNAISGMLLPELGQLNRLVVLDLANNKLHGQIPEELGRMASLKELSLAGNKNLTGMLPLEFTQLDIETFMLGDTQLCASADTEFQNWLRSVENSRVATCAIPVKATAYLTQATQSLDYPVPLVAGEEALLRVFIKADAGMDITMPPVRATFYRNGSVVYTANIPGEEFTIPEEFDENELSASANVEVPGSVIQPGLELVVEIDPGETFDSKHGIAARIPETVRMSPDIRQLPTFELTVVPFLWAEGPEISVLSVIDGLTPESDLLRPTRDLLPVNDFRLIIHAPIWTSVDPISDSVETMGPELEAIYAIEGERGYYLGIFRAQGPSGLLGIAQNIPSYISFSVLDPYVIAHELGHNLNLFHAPCGGAGGPDPFYPYDDGSIGVSGFDLLSGDLVGPETADLMSYCRPQWISDYSFTRALNHRMALGPVFATPPMAAASKGLLLWGGLDQAGELSLEPAFVVDASPVLPQEDGPYTLTGEREDGSVLFTLSFAISEYADAEGGSFAYILPVREDWSGSLDRISLTGPEGFDTIDEEGDQYVALMRDSATGEVRGILRDWPDPTDPSTAGRRIPPEPGMEIVISGGVPDPDSW